MGFLNNSGDIILDAVLTDTGRMRLAKGDGSFQITKFALADDEIDYGLFVSNTESVYQDIQILNTPVFEAFTNNAASMKSKLMSVNLKDILYLPVMKINPSFNNPSANSIMVGGFLVAVDKDTEDFFFGSTTIVNGLTPTGVLRGFSGQSQNIRIDQGIDFRGPTSLPSELFESQYIIEMDNRLGILLDKKRKQAPLSYIDDDSMASYVANFGVDMDMVSRNNVSSTDTSLSTTGVQVIAGPRGSILEFQVDASLSCKSSTYLFDTIGNTLSITRNPSTGTLKVIYSNIVITGGTTGFSISIPVGYVKYIK